MYAGGPEGIRYSKLSQIDRENVKTLQVAWGFDSGDSFPRIGKRMQPIVVHGVLYETTPKVKPRKTITATSA